MLLGSIRREGYLGRTVRAPTAVGTKLSFATKRGYYARATKIELPTTCQGSTGALGQPSAWAFFSLLERALQQTNDFQHVRTPLLKYSSMHRDTKSGMPPRQQERENPEQAFFDGREGSPRHVFIR